MPKREPKQKRDGNLAAVLKAANVTPDALKVPEFKISSKAVATEAAIKVLEEFGDKAVKAHVDELGDVLRLGFTPVKDVFYVALEAAHERGRGTLDAAIQAGIVRLIDWIKTLADDRYVAFAPTFWAEDENGGNASHGGVTVGAGVRWSRSQKAIEITLAVYVLIQK